MRAGLDLAELRAELGFAEPAIGYKYEYFSLFFLDVWTGDGEVVLYDQQDERHVVLDEEAMQALTGQSLDSIDPPLLYTVPLGCGIYGFLAAFVFIGWLAGTRDLLRRTAR